MKSYTCIAACLPFPRVARHLMRAGSACKTDNTLSYTVQLTFVLTRPSSPQAAVYILPMRGGVGAGGEVEE